MASTKEDQLVKPAAGLPELMRSKPEFLQKAEGQVPRGMDEMESKDWVLPRLSLCQSTSPQKNKNDHRYIPRLTEGNLFNSLTKQIYGEKVTVTPLFFFKTRWMFRDFDEGGGILCQAPDGKSCQLNHGGPCLHSNWGPSGEPPECNEFYNYPCLLHPSRDIVVVSLKSSGLKAAKAWNSLMRLRRADTFAGIYDIEVKQVTGKQQNAYFTYEVQNSPVNDGWVDNDTFKFAEEMYQSIFEGIKSGRAVVDIKDIAAEAADEEHFAAADSEM